MGKIGKKLSNILSRGTAMYDFKTSKSAERGPEASVGTIGIDELTANTLQPREDFDDEKLQELCASIQGKGVLQPIMYRKTGKGNEIIAGERRWRAAKMAGLERIPAIEMSVSDEEALELAIVENVQRDDLNAIEKARGFKALISNHSMTQQQVAGHVGISRTAVANFLRLLQLPAEVKKYVSRETLSTGHARCLLSMTSAKQQVALAKRIVKLGLSVRQTEEIVYGKPRAKGRQAKQRQRDANIVDLEKKLTKALGARVAIRNTRKNRGKIIIQYENNEDFCRICEQLGIDL